MKNISVIIPTYNGEHLVRKHLPDVLKMLRAGDELIIVNDASTDGTLSYLNHEFELEEDECMVSDTDCYAKKWKDISIRVLVNQTNQRFASSCNRGVKSANTDFVFLLNNDVSPKPDIVPLLLKHFENQETFAVGCKELAANEEDKEYGRSEARFKRGFLVHRRAFDQNGTDTFWASGGSSVFRKSMWDALDGFDLDYRPAYWEDIDLCFRARKVGWNIDFEPKAVVYHVHETTHKTVFGSSEIEIMAYKNSVLFVWKNIRGKLLLQHFLWLPYHLVFTSIRSQGKFLTGIWKAFQTLLT